MKDTRHKSSFTQAEDGLVRARAGLALGPIRISHARLRSVGRAYSHPPVYVDFTPPPSQRNDAGP